MRIISFIIGLLLLLGITFAGYYTTTHTDFVICLELLQQLWHL